MTRVQIFITTLLLSFHSEQAVSSACRQFGGGNHVTCYGVVVVIALEPRVGSVAVRMSSRFICSPKDGWIRDEDVMMFIVVFGENCGRSREGREDFWFVQQEKEDTISLPMRCRHKIAKNGDVDLVSIDRKTYCPSCCRTVISWVYIPNERSEVESVCFRSSFCRVR